MRQGRLFCFCSRNVHARKNSSLQSRRQDRIDCRVMSVIQGPVVEMRYVRCAAKGAYAIVTQFGKRESCVGASFITPPATKPHEEALKASHDSKAHRDTKR